MSGACLWPAITCEFCDKYPARLIRPSSESVRSVYGGRLACTRHVHWVRRLVFLDCGEVILDELPTNPNGPADV